MLGDDVVPSIDYLLVAHRVPVRLLLSHLQSVLRLHRTMHATGGPAGEWSQDAPDLCSQHGPSETNVLMKYAVYVV
jgi:hypothetical protein